MFIYQRLKRFFCASCVTILALTAVVAAQEPTLEIRVGEVTALPGDSNILVPVYLNNPHDSIAGLQVWFKTNRPDIVEFTTRDSFVDSVGTVTLTSFDTSGTILSGWEFVHSRSVTGTGQDYVLTALFDTPLDPTFPGRGIGPQTDGPPLVKLVMNAQPGLNLAFDETTGIFVEPFLNYFSFSTPDGNSLGLTIDQIPDTTWYNCVQWVDTVCLSWEIVSGPPADSMVIEMENVPRVDTTEVKLYPGSLTILNATCGDIDGSSDGVVDIGDLTRLIEFLFGGGQSLEHEWLADIDGVPGVDIGDLTTMIAFMFGTGAVSDCSPG